MSKFVNLKEIERRAYLSYHQDGVIDLGIGLCLLALGSTLVNQASDFASLIWIPIPLLPLLKKHITIPRLGYLRFESKRDPSVKRKFATVAAVVIVIGVAGLGLWAYSGYMPPELADLLGNHLSLNFGLLGAGIFAVKGFWREIDRFYAYSLSTVIAFVGGHLLDIPPSVSVLALGGFVSLMGLGMPIRFLRKYPNPDMRRAAGGGVR